MNYTKKITWYARKFSKITWVWFVSGTRPSIISPRNLTKLYLIRMRRRFKIVNFEAYAIFMTEAKYDHKYSHTHIQTDVVQTYRCNFFRDK